MSKIRVLPEVLANKIAAGEVVERPASVAKELVENALDAGATRIEVEIAAAGRGLVRVADDGEGMTRDDAILAFERHATSKLRTVEDLSNIVTFGFRGEALPTIASVSRLSLRTRLAAEPVGTEITITGGRLGDVRDVAWPGGTEVAVRDLFFNIPARRKFMKSDATETYHVTNLVTHYALANHSTAFSLVNNGRETLRVSPVGSLRERAYQVLGPGLVDRLVEVAAESNGIVVRGYVSNPQEQRTSRESQYLFVNGRFVRDRVLGRAIADGYRSMMPSGTFPAVVLFVELDAERTDVNVHPAKIEIRFREEPVVRSIVGSAIRDALERARRPVTSFPDPDSSSSPFREVYISSPPVGSAAVASPPRPELSSESAAEWTLESESSPRQSTLDIEFVSSASAPPPWTDGAGVGVAAESFEASGDMIGRDACESHRGLPVAPPSSQHAREGELRGHIRPLGQIRRSFVVATDEEGLLLIDQHVAHERILFERFRDASRSTQPLQQRLLLPETIDLTPAQSEAFERLQPELEAAGFEVLALSGRTVAISAVPAELPGGDLRTLLTELLEVVERGRGQASLDVLRETISASLACRAAIKINMTLTDEKMQWLIDELLKTQNPWTCPHGRPVILRFTVRDIERQFQRPEGYRRSP